jgi:hypothetical protein
MSTLKKIIYNCKQATFLIEKKALNKISFREELELRIHLFGCSMCKLYGKQSMAINDMVRQLFKDATAEAGTYTLDEDYKKQLQAKIEEELSK